MIVGLALGLAARSTGAPWLTETLATIGAIFVQLLKAIVPPLVFTAIVASIANLRAVADAARLAWKTLLWFAITAAIAVAIGLLLGTLIAPGKHAAVAASLAAAPASQGGWTDFLKGIVPANFLGLTATTSIGDHGPTTTLGINVLQLLVISVAIGLAAVKSGEAGAPFLAFVQSALVIVRKILWWIIRLTPVGTAGLIGTAVARYGWTALAGLGWFAFAVYLGLALVLFAVYPALLRLNGIPIRRFFAAAWPAIQLGFVTRSSIGTLPVTEEVTIERLGVPRAYASFAVPLGATTKMDGCAAIYPAIAALFVAQFYGVALGPTDYLLIALVSVLGSAATAGVTGATVMLTLTLSTLGLPLEGAGLLLAIDPILDMGRTAVNVAGQILVPLIVSTREQLSEGAEPVVAPGAPVLARGH
ncbi:sodium:proton antiporter [Sphingomonas deserti]|uniref:Sodium:proton antiporter n=2 Tax=Allosphingosinicella deserti TaxID=2116704 RepID=A0A2P7QF19_9SPHN|nr:sodium:proton antiporter [Sphingomonas deserti]